MTPTVKANRERVGFHVHFSPLFFWNMNQPFNQSPPPPPFLKSIPHEKMSCVAMYSSYHVLLMPRDAHRRGWLKLCFSFSFEMRGDGCVLRWRFSPGSCCCCCCCCSSHYSLSLSLSSAVSVSVSDSLSSSLSLSLSLPRSLALSRCWYRLPDLETIWNGRRMFKLCGMRFFIFPGYMYDVFIWDTSDPKG